MLNTLQRTIKKSFQVKPLSLFKSAERYQTTSQLTKETRKVSTFQETINDLDIKETFHRGKFANKLPDFSISPSEVSQNFEALSIPVVTNANINERIHPIELEAIKLRAEVDLYTKLKENQVIITNLPLNCKEFSTNQNVREYLQKNVHKDLDVVQVKLINALTTPKLDERLAYVVVTLGSKRQAHQVKKSLGRNHWIQDQLLKIRLQEDAKRESFDNRTILIRDLPDHLNQRQILEIFGEDAGAVVAIELPMENVLISNHLEERSVYGENSLLQQDKEINFKKAQIAVKQSLELDIQYQTAIAKELGQDIVTRMMTLGNEESSSLIKQEKMNGVLRIVTRLQAEGIQVLNYKYDLLKLRDQSSNSVAKTLQEGKGLKDKLELNKDSIERVLLYLRQNSDTVPNAPNESIEKLLQLGEGELAHSYDILIQGLDIREQLIEKRLGEQLQHFGLAERILQEEKNFDLELEDIQGVESYNNVKPEDIISINDQINYVFLNKNMSAEEKFSRLMKNALNPFVQPLFNEEQLGLAEHPSLMKTTEILDPRIPQTLLAELRQGTKFYPESREVVDLVIKEMREQINIPFDELYHREKALVQAVIEADKALKAKEASLIYPLESQMISKVEAQQIKGKSLLVNESTDVFNLSQKNLESRQMKNKLAEGTAESYNFQTQEHQKLNDMVESGEISQNQFEQMVQVAREQETRNLGYCFLTFSHYDEARIMIINNKNPYLFGRKIQIDLKSNIDHSELDFSFFMARTKNDAKLINDIKKLRDAKEQLKDFEKELDQQLPSRKKLIEFRKLAKNVIEGSDRRGTGNGASEMRTPKEEERLTEKIRILQAKYPHVDMSQLFVSEKAEDAKKALHKNAFASYKAYEFLKHGISKSDKVNQKSESQSDAKRRLQQNDPYNFPELDQTVSKVLSKDIMQPKLVEHGDPINNPGRRFNGYSESEFIESFFGKDLMRNHVVDRQKDPMFLMQDSLKKKYPISKFLKRDALDAVQQKLESFGIHSGVESFDKKTMTPYPLDPEIAKLVNMHDVNAQGTDLLVDRQHPEDENRTFLTDLESMLEKYEIAREKKGFKDIYDLRDIGTIRRDLIEEYGLFEKDWLHDVKKGRWKPEGEEEEGEVDAVTENLEIDETQSAKFSQVYDGNKDKEENILNGQLDPITQRINNEFMYNLKANPEEFGQKLSMDFQKTAQKNKITPQKLTESLKDKAHLEISGSTYGGKWFENHEFSKKTGKNQSFDIKANGGQTLSQFIQNENQLNEDQDDDDVFEMYQRQINQRTEKQNQTNPQFELNQNLHQPEMPRYESYFNYQSQGIHPFDKITDEVNESLNNQEGESQTEKDLDSKLYQREILGRLMGERLTPRQFEIISGQYGSADAKLQRVQNKIHENFLDRREEIRIYQEMAEQHRRKKIISKEWTEQESHQKLADYIKTVSDSTPGPHEQKKIRRNLDEILEALLLMENPERLLEKEYHFDETLGQSLSEHVQELKKAFPGVTVQTRRDRDGFAIVKTLYNTEYKYNLDKLEAWDGNESRIEHIKTIEAILKAVIPEEPKQILENIQNNFEKSVGVLTGQKPGQYELDAWTKLKIRELAVNKTNGKIETQELIDQLFQISEQAGFDESKPLSRIEGTVFDQNHQTSPLDILIADREKFRQEIYEQLMKRVKKHLFATERKNSDFVKPRISESAAFTGQVLSHERAISSLEQEQNNFDQKRKDFDKDAFNKIKDEIKQRKEAKERLLSQGLPSFKAYLRL